MGYSIFEGTMADMNWEEIEVAAKRKMPVLLPIGVIEEHGPHLPLGTDCYMSFDVCRQMKRALHKQGCEVLIAPPFYWGINKVTSGFPGSFSTRPETMIALLEDIFENLHSWGFENIFCFNCHGDYDHNHTALTAIKQSREKLRCNIRMVVGGYLLERLNLTGTEEHVLPIFIQLPEDALGVGIEPYEFDIHAGQIETASMATYFAELVDFEKVKNLPSNLLSVEQLGTWSQGGAITRALVPYGYAGNPAGYIREHDVNTIDAILSQESAKSIIESIEK